MRDFVPNVNTCLQQLNMTHTNIHKQKKNKLSGSIMCTAGWHIQNLLQPLNSLNTVSHISALDTTDAVTYARVSLVNLFFFQFGVNNSSEHMHLLWRGVRMFPHVGS